MSFDFLKKHFPIILLAIAVGALTILPQLFAILALGDKFQGIYHLVSNDEPYYLSRAQDIADGHNLLANTYLAEHKNDQASQFWLPDYLMAKPLAVLGLPVVKGYIFYDFLYPALLVILTYAAIYLITSTKYLSLTGAAVLHLGIFLEDFNRAPSPQFNFIFWLLLLILLIKYLLSQKRIFLILAALNLGLLFYLYPYYWMFYLTFVAVFIIINLFKDRKFNFLPYLYMIAGALFIGGWYIITTLRGLQSAAYQQSLERLGMLNTHFPSGFKIIFLAAAAMLAFFIFYKKKIVNFGRLEIFLISANLAAALAANQHLITGKNLEFSSHFLMMSEFSFVFTIIYLLSAWFRIGASKLASAVKIILLLSVIGFSALNAEKVAAKQAVINDDDVYQQNYSVIFNWLNDHTAKDSAVFADNDLSNLIPVYTGDNVYYSGNIILSAVANDEVIRRFVVNNFWARIDQAFVLNLERGIWGTKYISSYNHNLSKNKLRKLFGLKEAAYTRLPQSSVDQVLAAADKIKKTGFEISLKQYKADYLIWDKNKGHDWSLGKLKFLQPVFEKNNITIYKIN